MGKHKIVCEERNDEGFRFYNDKNVIGTIISTGECGGNKRVIETVPQYRIRKLTPKECWRLMGFSDEDFEAAEKVNCVSNLYKQAGNSIVVNVLEAIFGQMIEKDETDTTTERANNEQNCITYDIIQTVNVRKYEVDVDKLKETLKNAKTNVKLTNQQISEKLNIPLTKVEHWFRSDDFFAIPDAEIWLSLKELLCINTDEFDEAIMTFEERDGVYDKSNRAYGTEGISATLTASESGLNIIEPIIVASRGRNPQNPSDRTTGCPTEQRLEPNSQGICNTLTTVQKDNYVIEPVK